MARLAAKEKFWQKVSKTETCWNWMGHINHRGYGLVAMDDKTKRRAHRISWEMHYGPIPGGMLIDHICHNHVCVNPAHLRLATVKQNAENRAGAQSNSKTGIRGVTKYHYGDGWRATVGHHGLAINVGIFPTQELATAAVVAKRNELFTHNIEAPANVGASTTPTKETS